MEKMSSLSHTSLSMALCVNSPRPLAAVDPSLVGLGVDEVSSQIRHLGLRSSGGSS